MCGMPQLESGELTSFNLKFISKFSQTSLSNDTSPPHRTKVGTIQENWRLSWSVLLNHLLETNRQR